MALLGRNDLAKVLRSFLFFLIWIPSKNHGHTDTTTVPNALHDKERI